MQHTNPSEDRVGYPREGPFPLSTFRLSLTSGAPLSRSALAHGQIPPRDRAEPPRKPGRAHAGTVRYYRFTVGR